MSVRQPRRGAGFSIVAAIFLLTILAALGAFIVSVSNTESLSSALDVQGARAYQAARAGIEWGLYEVKRNGVTCSPATTNSFGFPNAPTLSTFTVTVVCTAYIDADGGPTVHQLVATACNQPASGACPNSSPGPNYVERKIRVSF